MSNGARLAVCLAFLAGTGAVADVVLLRNGSLLEGDPQWTDDSLLLTQPGGDLRLRAADVATVVDTPIAAYEWLRNERIASDAAVEDHLALASWAIDQRLWPQAARELLDARQAAPQHPRLALLERRFDELTRARETPSPAAAPKPTPAPVTEVADGLPRLPEGSVEFFTRRVQPLLRTGCATAGCHRGGEDDPFPLDPSWIHGHGDSRSTDRNLRAVLAAIDLGTPGRSPLLQAARGPHHGVTPLEGARREEWLGRLAAWTRGVASLNVEDLPAPPGGPVVASSTSVPTASPVRVDSAVQQASFHAPPTQRIIRGGPPKRVGPRDEFDPAIFNERFRRPEDDLPLNAAPRRAR